MPDPVSILERPQRWDTPFSPDMTETAVDRLLTIPPFSQMVADKFPRRMPLRDILRNDTRILNFRQGEIIMRQGDYGTSAFLILSGGARVVLNPGLPAELLGRKEPVKKGVWQTLAQLWSGRRTPESFPRSWRRGIKGVGARQNENQEVRLFLQDVPRVLDEHRTDAMEEGDFFGEIGALSRMPRTSTIFADRDITVELLEIRWQGLRDLMKYDDALRTHINKIYRERALASYLNAHALFRHLNSNQRAQVASQIEFGTYGDYDWSGDYKRLAQAGTRKPEQEPVIVQQGDYPNGVVLLRAGFGRVGQKFGAGERTLNYIGAGQAFGLREIAHNWRAPAAPVNMQYTLRAIGYTHVLIVPTRVMEEIVLPSLPAPELPPLVETAAGSEEPAAAAVRRETVSAETLEFLTANRFFNGTATMVIDLDRCTRCDDCVRACAATHDNNPRFLRHGPVSGRLMVANACMHCTDPVCMIGCPTGAIHRESFAGQVIINPATCIGCKACYNNCPYEAIRMVDLRDEHGAFVVDQELKPISKATKCDLCVENRGGPACERACPHGALARINLNNLDQLAQWLKR